MKKAFEIPDMKPVKYQRFLPAATIAASVALLAGCVIAVTAGATGSQYETSKISTATAQDVSSDAIVSTLLSMKTKKPEAERYEITSSNEAFSVSVFGGEADDVERVRQFMDVVSKNTEVVSEARLTEYDPKSQTGDYEGSMFLKAGPEVSLEESANTLKEFSAFKANVHFLVSRQATQFISVPMEEVDTVVPISKAIAERLHESIGKDSFSLSVRGDTREILVMHRKSDESVSKEEFKNSFNDVQEAVVMPASWEIVTK